MKKLLLLLGLTFVMILTACGGNEEAADTGEETASTEDGEAVYQAASCFSCHGNDLEGASGPSLQDVGSRLSEDEIRTTIEEGKGMMPAGLVAEQDDLDALVEWLSSKE